MSKTVNTTISLGKPITAPCLIPVLHASTPNCISNPFMVDGKAYRITALSFGTPHGTIVVNDVESVDISSLGSALGTHPRFPKGASIVFIEIIDNETVKARLWQYDVGEIDFTNDAIGVAAVVAMMLQKIMKHKATVLMGGNTFTVEWDRIGDVSLTDSTDLVQA